MITRADKGNAAVIIQKSTYLEKTENLFKDKKYYKEINTNPLPSLERKTNELIKKLNNMDFTGNGKKLPSVLQKFSISKAYDLNKIHKTGFPVRPIISTVNSPTYNVSKFFAKFLQHSLKLPASHFDNSLKLKEKINDIEIPSDFDNISLDVVSLFTNVPENLVVQSIEKRWAQLHNKINMSCTEFIEVIKFILNNNFFQFNKKIYKHSGLQWAILLVRFYRI